MYFRMICRASIAVLLLILCTDALLTAEPSGTPSAHSSDSAIVVTADQIKWSPAPPGLPHGAMMCVLEGDPGKPGPYTARIKTPVGFAVPAHWHSNDEHLTILSGTLHVGHGDKLDKSAATAVGAGGFVKMPAKMHHFAYAEEEVIFQVHGQGPFDINYINPADDPRKEGKAGSGAK